MSHAYGPLREPELESVAETLSWSLNAPARRRPEALAARGYPGVPAHVELAIEDDRLLANEGRVILHVAGGHAEVSRGGGGMVRLHARARAALISGPAPASMVSASGLVEGPAEGVSRLAAVFAGGGPLDARLLVTQPLLGVPSFTFLLHKRRRPRMHHCTRGRLATDGC